jgi:hypothetical protein
MSLVQNLLRAQRRQCEERRRYLAELEELSERLRTDALRLRAAIDDGPGEQLAAGQMVLRHAKVERSIAVIETQIGVAAAALAVAETELRQSEQAVAQHGGAGEFADAGRRRRGRRRGPAALPGSSNGRGG